MNNAYTVKFITSQRISNWVAFYRIDRGRNTNALAKQKSIKTRPMVKPKKQWIECVKDDSETRWQESARSRRE